MSRQSIKAVLIDLSGTLHVEDSAIQGSQAALERLQQSGLKIKFVTNTTKESKRSLHEKLVTLGFNIDQHEIYTSLTAAHNLVKERSLRPLLYLEKSAMEDFGSIPQDNPNAVVIGLAPSCFNYGSMNEAFRLIQEGADFIAIHKARYYKKKDGLAIGPGAFIEGLEYSTGCKAEIVGKPESRFFLGALETLDVCPEHAVMIGDDAKDDIAGCKLTGIAGILVKTGKYQPEDETKFKPAPDVTCEDFPAAVEYIISQMMSTS